MLIAIPLTFIGGLIIRAVLILDVLLEPNPEPEALLYLVELALLYSLLVIIISSVPLLILNLISIYFFNKTFSRHPSSFHKVLSDYTNVWTQSYVLFYLGSVIFLTGVHLDSSFLAGVALVSYTLCVVIFLLGSIIMMLFYFRHANKLKYSLVYVASFLTIASVYIFVLVRFSEDWVPNPFAFI